ncbi:DUF6025 family protein [Kitasatospora sp. NBC_01250]|uniref:DUF6025 family protein n=1 Tax=unclassified Kitasatospora TaxID=2633591 RepID=UPI002E15771E|nr:MULTISPECIES: DUF6025 family protein [unclassified Kitasatospora]WSJ71259.1 DUF6025 family protein [Kitasatospora sp. NBC_01302]
MSLQILGELGLGADAEGLADGTRTLTPVHLGTRDVPIGTVLDVIHRHDDLLPPRTGHLGNWADIAQGRAGAMDFNGAICGAGHGYPLIYGFTRTEADTEGGDDVYLPGSLVERGGARALPLYTWDGRQFALRDRGRPLFCPLVQTEREGELAALITVHWERMLGIPGYRFKSWAQSLMDNEALLLDMLCVLITEAVADSSPERTLSELLSHAVHLDGQVGRCGPVRDGAGFLLDGHRYDSVRALAEGTLLTLRALTEPTWFFANIAALPTVLPVPSLLLANVLFALFGEHRPEETGIPDEGPFITHLHWGARAMAGCPPRRNGYFARKTRLSPMRKILRTLVRHFPEAKPICFVLLPAQVFMLCPPGSSFGDLDQLAGVIKAVRAADPEQVHDVALREVASREEDFSDYLRGRFRPEAGVPRDGAAREADLSTEPEGFRELTFRQASSLVSAFEEVCGG